MKTAVEWLFDCMFDGSWDIDTQQKWLEKAKEMEKQQIIEAHGNKKRVSGGVTNHEYWYSGADYYNDKFKKDGQ